MSHGRAPLERAPAAAAGRSRAERASRLLLDLASCFASSHVIPELGARTKMTVVEELAAHARSLALVRDKTWFVGGLIKAGERDAERYGKRDGISAYAAPE